MKITKKQVAMIIEEIEYFGECFIGTMEVQGSEKIFKLYTKVGRSWEQKYPGETIAYDKETGIAWATE